MESAKEKLRQLEEELNNDDSTSCTSSLATTISDENDELNLGAEANSFDSSFLRNRGSFTQEHNERPQRYSNRAMVIMKEMYTSVESCDTNKTFSSISSVSDLLDARSGNAEEVLFNLGFSARNETHTRTEILSRFKAPIGLYKSPKMTPYNEDFNFTNDPSLGNYSESITKTKEWLAYHQDPSVNGYDYSRKSSGGSDQPPSMTSSAPGKRLPRNPKLRRKFSKSRQSSFELLLPNLKEEEATSDVDDRKKRTEEEGNPTFAPIRESSTELKTPTEKKNHLFANDLISSGSEMNSEKTDNTFIDEDDNSKKLPQTKRTNLINSQLESFELEEIISNEDASELHNPRSQNWGSPCRATRRIGVVAMPIAQRADLPSNRPKSHREIDAGARGNSGYETPPSDVGSDNESSSGFGEEELVHQEAHLQHQGTVISRQDTLVAELTPKDDDPVTKIVPRSVTQSVQTECECRNHFGGKPTISTRFEYDVALGAAQVTSLAPDDDVTSKRTDDVTNTANGNANSNKGFDFKSISLDGALNNPLYASMTSASRDVSPPHSGAVERPSHCGKYRGASKNRQRRRELACETAFTGSRADAAMTSLVGRGHVLATKNPSVSTRANSLFRSESAPVFLERTKGFKLEHLRKLKGTAGGGEAGGLKSTKSRINGFAAGSDGSDDCGGTLKNISNGSQTEEKRKDSNNNSKPEEGRVKRGKLVRQRPTTSINGSTS